MSNGIKFSTSEGIIVTGNCIINTLPRWVSMEECRPEDWAEVVTFSPDNGGYASIDTYNPWRGFDRNVTHWSRLPAPTEPFK